MKPQKIEGGKEGKIRRELSRMADQAHTSTEEFESTINAILFLIEDCKCECHKVVSEKVLSPWPSKCDCKCHEQGKKCCYDCIEIHYPINIKSK